MLLGFLQFFYINMKGAFLKIFFIYGCECPKNRRLTQLVYQFVGALNNPPNKKDYG